MDIQSQQNVIYALSNLSYRCTAFISKACKLKSNNYKLKEGVVCFGVIPYEGLGSLAKTFEIIQRRLFKKLKRKPKFLDIGCGTGNIVLLAHYLDYEAAGLEYNLRTYRIAKQLCNTHYLNNGIKIIRNDMRTFKHYSEYDVLYYYHPILSYNAMTEFSIKLAKEMKSGAYVVCVGPNYGFEQSKRFERIPSSYNIWRKK